MSGFRWTNRAPLRGSVDEAVKRVCLVIERTAKQHAPVDTGNLRRSISTEIEPATGEKATGRVGTGVHYAPYVEFGTRFTRAQPFLGPALEYARRRFG